MSSTAMPVAQLVGLEFAAPYAAWEDAQVAVAAEQVTMCTVRKHLDAQHVAAKDMTPLSHGCSSCLVHALQPAGEGKDNQCSKETQEYSLRVVVAEGMYTRKG